MLARDTRDAPNMLPAADAEELDATLLDADAAFARALALVRERLRCAGVVDVKGLGSPLPEPPPRCGRGGHWAADCGALP